MFLLPFGSRNTFFIRAERPKGRTRHKESNVTIPFVIENSGRGERSYDIFSRLLKDRIVLLCDEVNDATASLICAQLLFLR